MKVAIAFFAITLALTLASEQFSDETILLDVKSSIHAMKKKGATAADCKDLAKTTCKEVEAEHKSDERLVSKLHTGRHCVNKGKSGVTKAQVHYKKVKKTLRTAEIEVTKASNLRVTITSQRFKSLKVGKCGFIFSSRSYLSAKAKYSRAHRVVTKYKGIVSEAWKMVVTMKKTAARMVKSCHCRTKKAYYKVWNVVTSKKRVSRQNKAYSKCKLMSCILNGTNLSSKKCKGTLKKIPHKKLFGATARVSGCKTGGKPKKKIVRRKLKGTGKKCPSRWTRAAPHRPLCRTSMDCCCHKAAGVPMSMAPKAVVKKCMSKNFNSRPCCWKGSGYRRQAKKANPNMKGLCIFVNNPRWPFNQCLD